MPVYIHICMHVRLVTYMRGCVCCLSVRRCLCMLVCCHPSLYMYPYVYLHACMFISILQICVRMHADLIYQNSSVRTSATCTYKHVQAHIYIYIILYIYIHTRVRRQMHAYVHLTCRCVFTRSLSICAYTHANAFVCFGVSYK